MSIMVVFMDGQVHWYEGLVFFLLYMVYILFMTRNEQIATMARKMVSCPKIHDGAITDGPEADKGALTADVGENDGDEDTKVGDLQVSTFAAANMCQLHACAISLLPSVFWICLFKFCAPQCFPFVVQA